MKNSKIGILKLSFSFTIIILILFSANLNNIYAQDIISLYKDLIPSAIMKNPSLKSSINLTLQEKAKIHPELIYYYIERLNNIESNKVSQEVFNNYIYKKEKYYLSKRSIWANEQIAKLNEDSTNAILKSKCKNYFNELITSSLDKPTEISEPFIINSNVMNYIVFKYLKRDYTLVYDSTKDYHILRLNAENLAIKQYSDVYNSLSNSQPIKLGGFIETMLENWYYFADTNLVSTETNQYHQPYQIIEKIIGFDYSINLLPRITVNLGYCLYNSMFTLSQQFPISYGYFNSVNSNSYIYPSADISLSLPQIVGALGYRIYLKDYIGFLSFINLQLMFSISKNQVTTQSTTATNSSNNNSNINYSNSNYLQWDFTLRVMNSYLLKASTPIFVLGRSLFFNLSLNAGMLHYSSSNIYEGSMSQTEGYTAGSFWNSYYYTRKIMSGYGSGTIEVDRNYFLIYPTLDISYEFNAGVQLMASSSYKYFSLLCGYSF